MRTKLYNAGINSRRVKSPPAPKITRLQEGALSPWTKRLAVFVSGVLIDILGLGIRGGVFGGNSEAACPPFLRLGGQSVLVQ